jgi:DNA-binding NarL/FixJ family response regulator
VCTVLAVTRDTLLDAIDVLGYFDAVLFADQPIARQVAALEVALDGYILLPDYIDSRFTPDTVRAALAQWLTPRERHLLDVLATGATNRAISEMLGTTEANVKGLVRSVLKKLHLRNRTEAALFAVRNRTT